MSKVTDFIEARKKKNSNVRIGSLKEIYESQKHPPLPTGNVSADYVTSCGGFPRGLITEVRGHQSSGKTTLCAMAAAELQKRIKAGSDEGACLYLDFEHSVDAEYFLSLGLDVEDQDTFIYAQPDTLEDGAALMLDLIKSDLISMVIFDSIASASVKAEYEGEVGQQFVGNKAKAVGQMLRMAISPLKIHGVALVLINHTQKAIPTDFMSRQMASRGMLDKVSPGGTGMQYYPALRLETSQPTLTKEEVTNDLTQAKAKQVVSTFVNLTAFKNKVGVPHRFAKLKVTFGKGFDPVYSAFHILVDHKIINKKGGGYFVFPPELLGTTELDSVRGEDNVLQAITDNKEWSEKLNDAARKLVIHWQNNPDSDITIYDAEESIDPDTGEVLS